MQLGYGCVSVCVHVRERLRARGKEELNFKATSRKGVCEEWLLGLREQYKNRVR